MLLFRSISRLVYTKLCRDSVFEPHIGSPSKNSWETFSTNKHCLDIAVAESLRLCKNQLHFYDYSNKADQSPGAQVIHRFFLVHVFCTQIFSPDLAVIIVMISFLRILFLLFIVFLPDAPESDIVFPGKTFFNGKLSFCGILNQFQ